MATDTRHKQQGKHDTQGKVHADDRTAPRASQYRPETRKWDADRGFQGPFGMMRQVQDEVDNWFGRMGLTTPTAWMARATDAIGDWTPPIDAFQRGNEFVIRADVPGMTRTDLTVEAGDDSLTIRGERKHEKHEGVLWSERSHGSFCRVVPLPAGAISDSAKASFANGVLEIVIEAPSQEARRGRRVDISGHDDTNKK